MHSRAKDADIFATANNRRAASSAGSARMAPPISFTAEGATMGSPARLSAVALAVPLAVSLCIALAAGAQASHRPRRLW